jgi:anaerobic selenocysteine-containing dehydrogenase
MSEWHPTACILCECNCGLQVQLGGEGGRHITRLKGDKAHPASQGYICQKATRLDHYQNGKDRITAPLRRRADGSFEEIDWDTAIREVADRLAAVRDTHGGESIFYYGGGGQGNHMGGGYARDTRSALGSRYRSNALAQEKTGEFWVNGRMFGSAVRADVERGEVVVFLGKNPWQSHGISRARVVLREISRDPNRCMIVIDPRRSETAALADIHLQLKPGTDAWLLLAMLGILVQEDLIAKDWVEAHTDGLEQVLPLLREIPIDEYCAAANIPEDRVRAATARIASANSVAMYEDLGVQMNRHSTLVSYLEKLVWVLTGNFGNEGGQNIPAPLLSIVGSCKVQGKSPVAGAPLISGLVPCNVIAEEILSDHPDRYRAMIVESGNPVHSLADSQRMREALRKLDVVVVIDIAMTETAREADYILPAPTQYEKWEATFFNFEFPKNYFHLRKPLFDAPPGVLPEPEIHARLVEALGASPTEAIDTLREALKSGKAAFRGAFLSLTQRDPDVMKQVSTLLYRALGPTLKEGAAGAAMLWGAAQMLAIREPESVRRAGHGSGGDPPGDELFEAILDGHSGVVIVEDEPGASWRRLGVPDGRIQLAIPELLEQIADFSSSPEAITSEKFPFILSAGERRDYTANTIYRDPNWRRKDRDGALRVSPADAASLGLQDGGNARVTTERGSAVTVVEVTDWMQDGHVSLPNGLGLSVTADDGTVRTGVAVNELTASARRDAFAGTPWHKLVPVGIEPIPTEFTPMEERT